MDRVVLLLTVVLIVGTSLAVLLPMLTTRADTPEKQAERDARLRDELAAWS